MEEMLEKRVRSRLSNMKVHLEVDYSFDDYVEIFRDVLTLPGSHGDPSYRKKWNGSVQVQCVCVCVCVCVFYIIMHVTLLFMTELIVSNADSTLDSTLAALL